MITMSSENEGDHAAEVKLRIGAATMQPNYFFRAATMARFSSLNREPERFARLLGL